MLTRRNRSVAVLSAGGVMFAVAAVAAVWVFVRLVGALNSLDLLGFGIYTVTAIAVLAFATSCACFLRARETAGQSDAPAPIRCDDCGRRMQTTLGLSQHRAAKHLQP